MSIFLKASTEALKRFPDINASIDGDEIVYHGFCDIGVAVSSDRGLVVPVIRNTEHMSLADMEKAIGEYAGKARDGKLAVEDMTGGTFTVSNGGVFGSMMSTPIFEPSAERHPRHARDPGARRRRGRRDRHPADDVHRPLLRSPASSTARAPSASSRRSRSWSRNRGGSRWTCSGSGRKALHGQRPLASPSRASTMTQPPLGTRVGS